MNFSVTLNIKDVLISNCIKNTNNSDIIITATSQVIELQNGYILNVVSVNQRYITLVIQNGTYVYIRNIFLNYDCNICLPTENPCRFKHILTIGVSNIING